MTLFTFIQIACITVFIIYFLSVNLYQKDRTKTPRRPEAGKFSFFEKKNNGMTEEEIKKALNQ
jgi:hypothetical protein